MADGLAPEAIAELRALLSTPPGRRQPALSPFMVDQIVAGICQCVEQYTLLRDAAQDLDFQAVRTWAERVHAALVDVEALLTDGRFATITVRREALAELAPLREDLDFWRKGWPRGSPGDPNLRGLNMGIADWLDAAGLSVTEAPDGLLGRVLGVVHVAIGCPERDLSRTLRTVRAALPELRELRALRREIEARDDLSRRTSP